MSTHRLSMRASTGDATYRLLPEIFKHKLVQMAEETVTSLQGIWSEAGYEESERQRLLGELLNKLKTACANEVASEEQILAHARQEVETLTTDVVTKHVQLGRTAKLDHIAKLTVTDKLTELDKIFNVISKEVDERQSLFDKEMQVISTIVQELGETMPPANAFDGPAGTPTFADVRLNLMRDCRARLEGQRQQRRQELEALYRECVAHMQDMCYVEDGSIHPQEQSAFKELDAGISRFARAMQVNASNAELPLMALTKQHVQQMSTRVEKLVAEKEYRRTELSKTGEEIARLWSLLRVERADREAFTASFKKNLSIETLRKGYGEANRLRQLRKESLGSVLGVLRSDIETLWIEIGMLSAPFSAQETPNEHETQLCEQEFAKFFVPIEDATEDLLDTHEVYFTSLRQRVEELRPLLLKIHRREVIVQERIELEQLQMNPERLTARGPNAREERKREEAMTNRVKMLEKLTKEIVNAIATYEKEAGKEFLYGGDRYSDRIARQEEAFTEMRDSMRNARKNGKKDVSGIVAAASASSMMGGSSTSNLSASVGGGASSRASTTTPAKSMTTSTPKVTRHNSVSASAASASIAAAAAVAIQDHHDVENQPIVSNSASTNRARTASKDASSRIPTFQTSQSVSHLPVKETVVDVTRDKETDRDSDNTMYTSLTEVKERHSGGSVTVVRETVEC